MSNLAATKSSADLGPMLSDRHILTLDTLYEAAADLNFTPGWIPREKPILWAEPRSEFLAARWTYGEAPRVGLDVGRAV